MFQKNLLSLFQNALSNDFKLKATFTVRHLGFGLGLGLGLDPNPKPNETLIQSSIHFCIEIKKKNLRLKKLLGLKNFETSKICFNFY